MAGSGERARAALHRYFGYPSFRPGQERLVCAALEGRDALGILPTGGGKSVCYMLPAALLPGVTIVVSPLISLMDDQVQRANRVGIPAALFNSTLGPAERREVLAKLEDGALRLLLVAPERFQVPAFREALDRTRVSLLAVDEAHCIAAWGYDFRPSYLALGGVRSALGTPCLALTATATPSVQDELVRSLGLRDPVRQVGSFDRPNLRWEVVRVRSDREKERWVRALFRAVASAPEGSAIAYAATRRTVEHLRDRLSGLGLPVDPYHGGMAAEERAAVQAAFLSGERRLIVATNAFGMGVDKPDVRLVVHWSLPGSLEGYYQEAGRAGRDGEPARCVALHRRGDGRLPRAFLDRSRPPVRVLRRVLRALRDTLGEDGRGVVAPPPLARRLGRGWSPERVAAALRALAGAGLVRLRPASEATGEPEETRLLHVSVRPGRPDLRRARSLRRRGLRRLRAVRRYATHRGCRRRFILGYFGEARFDEPCGGCDRCDGEAASDALGR